MMSTAYIFLYLFSNLLRTFSIYLFMESALSTSKRRVSIPCYFGFFLIVSMTYLLIDIPIITLLVNILGTISLGFIYPATFRQRIISSLFIYAVAVFSEAIVLALTNYISFSFTEKGYYDSLFGIICTPLLLFSFVVIYRTKHRNNQRINIPFSYTITVLIIPISFIVITVFLFSFASLKDWQIIFIITILFIFTFGTYLVYERQIRFFSDQNDIRILEAQNLYYKNQLEIIKDNTERIRKIEHDMKNHLMTISSLAKNDNSKKTQEYINHLQNEIIINDFVTDTGNPVIDGIINVKSLIAQKRGINIRTNLQLPAKCPIEDIDATVLLGNLLDNAIENSIGTIYLSLRYTNGLLFIVCSNPFSGRIIKSGNLLLTTKDNPSLHGYGYKNMLRITEKYNGTITCDTITDCFHIRIILNLL